MPFWDESAKNLLLMLNRRQELKQQDRTVNILTWMSHRCLNMKFRLMSAICVGHNATNIDWKAWNFTLISILQNYIQQISTSQSWWKPRGWNVALVHRHLWSFYKIRSPRLMILQHQSCNTVQSHHLCKC